MAKTDLVTEARRPIYIGDVEENNPNSESVNQKLSGNINFLLNRLATPIDIVIDGFFKAGTYDDGMGGIYRVENNAQVITYYMAVRGSGSGSNNQINARVYDQNGAFVNTLFGAGANQPSISGNNGTNVIVGKEKIDTGSPSNITVNTAGHTIQVGSLNLGTEVAPLLAGYFLVPYIVANGNLAHNIHLSLRLKEI